MQLTKLLQTIRKNYLEIACPECLARYTTAMHYLPNKRELHGMFWFEFYFSLYGRFYNKPFQSQNISTQNFEQLILTEIYEQINLKIENVNRNFPLTNVVLFVLNN